MANPGRIIPKLLSARLQCFKYPSCVFERVGDKKRTARVYFRRKFAIDSVTFEQSYGLANRRLISIQDWKAFGNALIESLIHYTTHYLASTDRMSEYLAPEITVDSERAKRRRARCESE